MSEVKESNTGAKTCGTDARGESPEASVYPQARRLWAWSSGHALNGKPDLDVTQALSSTFGATYTPLAVRVLDVVIRALETSNRDVTEATVRHHVLLRSDHLLEAVLQPWLAQNHQGRENWEHDLKSHLSPKDPRRVTAIIAIYRNLVHAGKNPYDLVDWMILIAEIPRDEYAVVATVAADILAFFGAGALSAGNHLAS